MKILLLNDSYFLASFRRLGHEVFFVSPSPQADLVLDMEPTELRPLLAECPFPPDFLLWSDSINLRAAFIGLEEIHIPRLFYGVDAPLNAFWQRDFCRVFDLAFLDQKALVTQVKLAFPDTASQVHWLPLGADPYLYQPLPLEKKYDLAFVGSLNPRLRPKRSWLLAELKRHYQVNVFDGQNQRALTPVEVVKVYNQSKIVVNENLFPGLNLRTFEVLSCGACLLTEQGDDSYRVFFQDWQHLVTFTPENIVERVEKLLSNTELRQRIAMAGRDLVRQAHTIDHRAQILLRSAEKMMQKASQDNSFHRRCYHLGKGYLALSERWHHQPVAALRTEGIRLLWGAATGGFETADLHFELGAQALTENRWQHARGSLARALELDPAHFRSLWASFWCQRDLGEHGIAWMELLRLHQYFGIKNIDPNFAKRIQEGCELTASDFCSLGELLEKAGLIIETGIDRLNGHPCRWNAYDAYQKALALNPLEEISYLRCVHLLESLGSFEFALVYLEKAVELKPLEPSRRLHFAQLCMKSYRRTEGIRQLLEYLFLSTEPEKWERVEALRLTEAERNYLLDSVWDYSRRKTDAILTSKPPHEVLKAALQNSSRNDESA